MSSTESASSRHLTVRQAAFIGVGAMVGAGIFSLLGPAGEVAGAAVWLSFAIAGAIAGLQGYSFAKFGARYPSAGGLLEYVQKAYGDGHFTGIIAWLIYATNIVVTAMVAISFGSYATEMFTEGSASWLKGFAVLVVVVMTLLNVAGSRAVAHAQTVVVIVVLGSLIVFAIATLANVEPGLLDTSTYPSFTDIIASVALTFFAFLGFGVITFTAKDLADPPRQLPRAVYLALGIATTIYVAIALGVFGTLPVEEVVAAGATAIAVAAEPILGTLGFWMMSITALFATAGATNAGLYPATGLADELASDQQFPPLMAARTGKIPNGLLFTALGSIVLVLLFDLSAVASIGSAIALVVFTLITAGHIRVRRDTGARLWLLLLGVLSSGVVLVAFALTTLVDEPGTAIAMVAFLVLSVVIDLLWKSRRARARRSVA
ncbi:MAG TPA: APC family permease [Acidimicrobiia bacterium]|nr:APC family permease [Acidimicrobiia bacterium]